MKMSIDDAIETLLDTRSYGTADIAKSVAIDTMRKYQKIQEIMKSKKMNALNIGLLIPKDMACVLYEIKEVIEDGNVN